jgi:hypothetical protein
MSSSSSLDELVLVYLQSRGLSKSLKAFVRETNVSRVPSTSRL